jgi:hypothetical protein
MQIAMSSMKSKIAMVVGALLISTALVFAQGRPNGVQPITSDGETALVENGWDFTSPAGVPGFGPMRPEDDTTALLAQVLGQKSPPVVVEAAHQRRHEARSER